MWGAWRARLRGRVVPMQLAGRHGSCTVLPCAPSPAVQVPAPRHRAHLPPLVVFTIFAVCCLLNVGG